MDIFKINRNNTEIHYEYLSSIRETEETVILLHGNGLDSQSWYKILDGLREHYNVLMYDFPGQGQSPLKTRLPSWEELCEDLKLLTEHLQINSYHLIGHGAGGNMAIIYANVYPDFVKTLCIISTPCFYPVKEMQKYISFRKNLVREFGKEQLIDYMMPKITIQSENSKEWITIRRGYDAVTLEMHFHFYDLVVKTDWISQLKKIRIPTLVLAGEKDPIFTPYPSLATSCFLENSEYVNILDASNMIFIDRPEETLRQLRRFIFNTNHSPDFGQQDILNLLHKKTKELFAEYQPINPLPVITIKLIGEFSIEIDHKTIDKGWNKRKAKSLLLYLSFYRTAVREQIIDDFWSENNLVHAQNQLRVSLNYLKSLLADYGYPDIFKSDREYIRIDAIINSDIHELYRILTNESFEENRVNLETVLYRYVDAFSENNFLIGFSDDWSVRLKDLLTNRMNYWADRLFNFYNKNGNDEKAAIFRDILNKL